ncbi:S8 family serine peptidase, partial [bacterium]|nr:S8 family serine peptidase [bacterium]
ADKGAKVINMSWGSFTNFSVLQEAVQYAYNKGCVLVGATGNDGENQVYYPARYSQVIGVGAIDSSGRLTSFTNRGEGLDFAAPGVSIYTTLLGGSCGNAGNGTSFATPIVAGVASVLWAKQPHLSNSQVRAKILGLSSKVSNYNLYYPHLFKVLKIYLIKTSSSYTYIVDGGKKYALWPSSTFWQRFGFKSSYVETVPSSVLNSYPSGGWFTGLWRVSGSSQWYYIDRARRFPVWPSDAFKARWGFKEEDVRVVTSDLLSLFPYERWLTGLVRGETISQVYYIDRGGRKYPVWPSDIFWGRWGFNRDFDITVISDAQLKWMPTDRWLTGLVRGDRDGQLYWIDYYGKKFKIPYGMYFWTQWGFSLADVTVISQEQMDWIPYGGELSLYIKGELLPLVCRMTYGRCPIVSPPAGVAITTISQGQFNYMPR